MSAQPNIQSLIVGLGHVGKSIELEMMSVGDTFTITEQDGEIVKSFDDYDDLTPDIVFYCLPTNLGSFGTLDIKLITQYLRDLRTRYPQSLHTITSTLPLIALETIPELVEPGVLFLPEFRSESDLNSGVFRDRVLIGSNRTEDRDRFVSLFPRNYFRTIVDLTVGEAVLSKLMANSYLGLRLSFFNELSLAANQLGHDANRVIEAIGTDFRIGDYYNTPGFGFGGPCLPKDISSLSHELGVMGWSDKTLIRNILESNKNTVKDIVDHVIATGIKEIGFSGVTMSIRGTSTNTDTSTVLSIMGSLRRAGCNVYYFDNAVDLSDERFIKCRSFSELKELSGLILSQSDILDYTGPVITGTKRRLDN